MVKKALLLLFSFLYWITFRTVNHSITICLAKIRDEIIPSKKKKFIIKKFQKLLLLSKINIASNIKLERDIC
jgi:hypothetical protein